MESNKENKRGIPKEMFNYREENKITSCGEKKVNYQPLIWTSVNDYLSNVDDNGDHLESGDTVSSDFTLIPLAADAYKATVNTRMYRKFFASFFTNLGTSETGHDVINMVLTYIADIADIADPALMLPYDTDVEWMTRSEILSNIEEFTDDPMVESSLELSGEKEPLVNVSLYWSDYINSCIEHSVAQGKMNLKFSVEEWQMQCEKVFKNLACIILTSLIYSDDNVFLPAASLNVKDYDCNDLDLKSIDIYSYIQNINLKELFNQNLASYRNLIAYLSDKIISVYSHAGYQIQSYMDKSKDNDYLNYTGIVFTWSTTWC